MLYFLISFVSFVILFCKSFSIKPLSSWENGTTKLVSTEFWGKLLSLLVSRLRTGSTFSSFLQFSLGMPLRKKSCLVSNKVENGKEEEGKVFSLLDLPDLPMECILEHLSPAELCNVATVCTSLRDRCMCDYLWERHMKRKWGKVIGDAAYKQWKWHVASSRNKEKASKQHNQKRVLANFLHGFLLPFKSSKSGNGRQSRSSLPDDSIASLYLSLESGKFWFPAQVYNREVIGCRKIFIFMTFFMGMLFLISRIKNYQ